MVIVEINKREVITCERDRRRGKSIVRIFRLKPNAAGTMRSAGSEIEFADKHLPGVIDMLTDLQKAGIGND
jgi:hypothetical protein